ncbi:hypothetical protein C4D60_Mb08t03470 [Musa balbisiana]|uniref:Uncharacterized protein n=1 Tax=Musa balbisiana TaxID=52838 RepID=A0A4S8K114_MUSBA|nr:hypothetical protein C4D60_Mb08t03470 [Musa balbisiana]
MAGRNSGSCCRIESHELLNEKVVVEIEASPVMISKGPVHADISTCDYTNIPVGTKKGMRKIRGGGGGGGVMSNMRTQKSPSDQPMKRASNPCYSPERIT